MGTLPSWMLEVISPRPDDSSDLRWAVETVSAMWSRGDGRKTLLWLKQAAETARGDGMDQRAQGLAMAAAEFERLGMAEGTGSGEYAGVSAPDPSPQSNTPKPGSAGRRKLPPTAPYSLEDQPTRLEAPASDLIEAIRRIDDTDPDQPPQPEAAPAPVRPLPPEARREPLEPTVIMENESGVASTAPLSPAPPAAAQPAPEPRASSNPPTLESPRAPLEPMRAVRVAVRLGGGSELSALLLADGESAPEGTQEAILLAVASAPRS